MNKSPFADMNATVKKIELENLEKGEIFPVTIVKDRYGGSYSHAKWLAIQCNNDDVPLEIGGSDPDEEYFWMNHKDENLPIGKGDTPNEAYEDLKRKAKEYYKKW